MDDKLFKGLLEATKEALAHCKGERLDLRTTELPGPPEPVSRAAIKRLRTRLKVSQPVFARCLGEAWRGSAEEAAEGGVLRDPLRNFAVCVAAQLHLRTRLTLGQERPG